MTAKLIAAALVSLFFSLPAIANDESDIRAVVNKVENGYNGYDAAKIASAYTDDALWQNPFGVRLHGRANIQKFLTVLFNRPGYRSGKNTSVLTTEVHFVTPNAAVAWSLETSAGQIDDATGKPIGPRKSHYMEVLVRRPGGWLITDEMIMDEKDLPK